MATQQTLQTIGNWRGEIGVAMETALHVSMDVAGRSGAQACQHALILMHQSAAALTPRSKAKRPIESDNLGQFVRVLWQGPSHFKRYKWQYNADQRAQEEATLLRRGVYGRRRRAQRIGTWEGVQRIRSRGLAKRSWMWALNSMGKSGGKPIPGVTWIRRISEGMRNGFATGNALSYLPKIMPSGWAAAAEHAAANKIMAQAAQRINGEIVRRLGLPRGTKIPRPSMAQLFAAQGVG